MELWSILVGALAMLVIQVLKGRTWGKELKVVLVLTVSVVLATVEVVVLSQTFTWQGIATNMGIIMSTATTLYKMYFEKILW